MKGSTAEPVPGRSPDSSLPSVSINILSSDADFDYSLAVCPESQSRTFTIRGRISAPRHPVDGKPGTVTICEDDARAETLRVERCCGSLIFFEAGKLDFGDAFRALLFVKCNIADTIDRAITSAHTRGRMISVELDVALEGLPDDRKYYISDLDVRDERVGNILGFKLWPWSWKPGQSSPWYLCEPTIELRLSLTEGGWWGLLPWGADMLSFRGMIDSSQLPELIGLSCKIELREYQVHLGGESPSAGEFSLQYNFPEITLFYRASDFSARLKPLLKCRRVWLCLKVAVEKSKLLDKLASIQADDVVGRIIYCAIGGEARIDPTTPAAPPNAGD